MSTEFKGRTALVTGGSRGIGRAVCVALANGGANVAVNYRANRTAANETARLVGEAGTAALVVQADVSQADEVDRMVAEAEHELGPIDLLVNNAGVFDYVSHAETTLEIWQRTLDNNLTSAFLVTWALKDGMLARGFGRIVNMSSISGLRPRPNSIAYAASKAGLIGLTKSLAEAVADKNLRVNGIAPGLIETDIIADVDQAALDTIIKATPMQRIGTPEEIADLATFLLSERSRFMTGQTLVASGGRVMLP